MTENKLRPTLRIMAESHIKKPRIKDINGGFQLLLVAHPVGERQMSNRIYFQFFNFDYLQLRGDPFPGSGTTAVAASLHGRKHIGIELKKEYFDNAKKNIDEVKNIETQKL